MTAMTATTPARSGATSTGTAVTASDTISTTVLGTRGVLVEVINGNGSNNTVGISDASLTKSGAAATAVSKVVTNGTAQIFRIYPQQADRSTKVVTITHSITTSVTYKMYPLS
jgi:hypothetical protein